ncbi:MAG: MotA/TolQ/ExbB proton channel family protein [Desulfobacterales bacterium]|nr:MAG: MotA/TolQ/ExbB proton channel family protein [Desulfobacterales bacterium]
MTTRGQKALIHMLVILIIGIAAAIGVTLWKTELVRNIFLATEMTYILNGIILLLFFLGIIQIIRGLRHCAFEEDQVSGFIRNKEELFDENNLFANLAQDSMIANRYFTVKNLFSRRIPIDHRAISSIMVAEESSYQSFPKFVNNVLILAGVFGTVISLIYALAGAGAVLDTSVAAEGMGTMLRGMNTALTTTGTALVCFFFFTYFYQKLTDVQTYLMGQIEKAVLIHIIPEFAFDSETVNYNTVVLIKELRQLVSEIKAGTAYIEETLASLNQHNTIHSSKMDALISRQDNQIQKAENVIHGLDGVRDILKAGFRIKE